MQKITPFLWFDTQAEEAMRFYTSLFPRSEISSIKRYPDGPLEGPMQGMEGKVLTGVFELAGHRFMALDGGPHFKFTPAISFMVQCATEEQIDQLWSTLSEGGQTLVPLDAYPFSPKFGWLADRYGLSWQLSLAEDAGEQTITPALMFVREQCGRAEEAIHLYTSLFEDSRVEEILRYGPGEEPDEEGTVKYVGFVLNNQPFSAMDSAQDHQFSFNEAISLYVSCDSQEEVDQLWDRLSAHPEAEQCGWLKDRYGVSWQIVPEEAIALMDGPDPEGSGRAMQALMQMKKIDVAAMKQAYEAS
jgi:predicted 3-demethylubiquinone-9 3-methyltransferase (glyoxalase superfamily)